MGMIQAFLGSRHSTSWNPSQIGSMLLWLKADAITGLSSGDALSEWDDSSGKGNDASASGSARPTFTQNVLNGLPGVQFNGITNYLNGNLIITGNSLSVFAVANLKSNGSENLRLLSVGVSGSPDYTGEDYADALSQGGSDERLFAYRNAQLSTRPVTYGNAFAVTSVFDGAFHKLSVNGVAGDPVSSSYDFNTLNYTIGNSVQITSELWYGDIHEICVYSGVLNSTQLGLLHAYSQNKWGTP